MKNRNYTPSDSHRRAYLQKVGNAEILNSDEITKKRIYNFGTIALATAGLVTLLSCAGCVSPEARQVKEADPYRLLNSEQVPKGSPRSNNYDTPLWFDILSIFVH